ncbi:MAG: macro domain-containing protein [Bacteroidales bacterium]|nr:macro domain-containing protein [Bacteroidales bacterium]
MPLLISRNDITKIDVDVIVNAANTALQMGGGVCGAIFRAAGPSELQAACDKLAPIKTGEAVITDGFKSKAKYIIHTAGPIYQGGNTAQEKQLYDCYFNSLKLASEKNLKSIAFPLISAGIYGYPPNKALSTALKSIHDFLGGYDGEMTVYMIVYNDDAFSAAKKLYDGVESYIDEKLIVNDIERRRRSGNFSCKNSDVEYPESILCESEIFANLEDSFNTKLFDFIRQKQMTNADVYKNANIDRRLFSKIISNDTYTPSKNTIFALAISLKLNLKETESLLKSAGYAISHSSKSDLIIEYYILHNQSKNYNIDELNFLLYQHQQIQLGQE